MKVLWTPSEVCRAEHGVADPLQLGTGSQAVLLVEEAGVGPVGRKRLGLPPGPLQRDHQAAADPLA